MTPNTEFDNYGWLMMFMSERKQEAKRLREMVDWPKHLPKRSKPWPRKRGLTGIKGLRMMWRV